MEKVTHGCCWESTEMAWHICGPQTNIKWRGTTSGFKPPAFPPSWQLDECTRDSRPFAHYRVTASFCTQITSVLHGHLPTVQLSNFARQYYHGSCPVAPKNPCPCLWHAGIRSCTISTIPIPSQCSAPGTPAVFHANNANAIPTCWDFAPWVGSFFQNICNLAPCTTSLHMVQHGQTPQNLKDSIYYHIIKSLI